MNVLPQQELRADDAALAEGAASGDPAAFELLMRRHNRRLYRLARATLRDDADAEDALQETYLRAIKAIGRFRGESSLATWLSRLLLHECLDRLRREGRRRDIAQMVSTDADEHVEQESMNDRSPHGTPHDLAERAELRALLERKLDALPEAFRTVFVLAAWRRWT